MELTILGSGGCTVIPKPLCPCLVCKEAREKGPPYERTGPSAFIHDENILIDTPAEIACQLNRSRIEHIDYLIFTHLDPDHVEGFRVVEQIALDFRTWEAYVDKTITLVLPARLREPLRGLRSSYGPVVDFYEKQGFIQCTFFQESIRLKKLLVTAIAIEGDSHLSFMYVFEKDGKRLVYAPCDVKPFPEQREEVKGADLLVIQPGIFEEGLKHGFRYPRTHISRTTLYTFDQTVRLAKRIGAKKVLFTHLEEYWNRSYGDYCAMERAFHNFRFAYDGMRVTV